MKSLCFIMHPYSCLNWIVSGNVRQCLTLRYPTENERRFMCILHVMDTVTPIQTRSGRVQTRRTNVRHSEIDTGLFLNQHQQHNLNSILSHKTIQCDSTPLRLDESLPTRGRTRSRPRVLSSPFSRCSICL